MEPVAVHSQLVSALRLAGTAGAPSLSELLADGRVLAGQVLEEMAQGGLLLAVGPHRLPAESHVSLREGDAFLFRVERGPEGLTLRVLGGREGAVEPPLLRALRGVVGQDRPVGELLEELAAEIRRALPKSGGGLRARLDALLTRLEGSIFRPGTAPAAGLAGPAGPAPFLPTEAGPGAPASPAAGPNASASTADLAGLVERMRAAGLDVAARAAATERHPGAQPSPAAGRDLLAGLLRAARGLDPGPARDALLAELRALSPAGRGQLLEAVRAGAARAGAHPRGAPPLASPAAEGTHAGRELMRVIGESGLDHEARLLAALRAARPAEHLRGLATDLKAELLSVLSALPEGAVREAVSRTLSAFDAEQLLNLARREGGEPVHLSFPVPDGAHLATVHLFVEPRREEEGGRRRGASAPRRLVLGADLSALGPVRVDLTARPGLLHVRLLAAREDVAERLARDAQGLAERLATDGRRVVLTAAHGRLEDVDLSRRAREVNWLRDHPLMDVRG
jgi:hypothetical protein